MSTNKDDKSKMPWWKYTLATLGVAYAIGSVIWLVLLASKSFEPVGPSALAQHPERQNELLAERRAMKMQEDLGLTSEQTALVTTIMEAFQAARKERFLSTPEANPLARMQVMMELREEVRGKLAAVLDPEQLERFESTQQARFGEVFSALRQTGIAPVNPAAVPKTQEARRERLMNLLQPTEPATPAAE